MYENPTDEQHSAACSVLVLEVLKPTQPLAEPVPLTMVQASSTTHNTSVVPSCSPLWFSPKLHNQCAGVQPGINSELQGMSTSVTVAVDADDDTFLDSVLASSDLQL